MRALVPLLFVIAVASSACQMAERAVVREELAWQALPLHGGPAGWESVSFGGEGEVEFDGQSIRMGFGSPLTAVAWKGAELLPADYEIEVVAARLDGSDFFCALNFPIGEQRATVVLGGWGGALCGLSCVNGDDASMNATRSFHSFERGKSYRLRVRVDAQQVQAWVDDTLLFAQARDGVEFSLRTEVSPAGPLALSCFQTSARIEAVRWRGIPDQGVMVSGTEAETSRMPFRSVVTTQAQ
jgi:hypothetical protein